MNTLKNIPTKTKKMYNIGDFKTVVHIHEPSYINVRKDELYTVEKNDNCILITNSKVCVSLWINTKIMHVTVLA